LHAARLAAISKSGSVQSLASRVRIKEFQYGISWGRMKQCSGGWISVIALDMELSAP
jgi:hypothetical protein